MKITKTVRLHQKNFEKKNFCCKARILFALDSFFIETAEKFVVYYKNSANRYKKTSKAIEIRRKAAKSRVLKRTKFKRKQ